MLIEIDKHITLELIATKDADEMFELVSNNMNHLRERLPWVDNVKDVTFFHQFIKGAKQRCADGQELPFVILYNKKIVGRIGIYKMDHFNKIGEIGYWIAEEWQGKGIISKSCGGLIEYGFSNLNLNRFEIKCATNNVKSQQIPKRFNFQFEGTIREAEYLNGKFNDLYQYSLIKKDWI